MKKPMLIAVWLAFLAVRRDVSGQGTIVFNNLGTSDGLVFQFSGRFSGDGVPLNQDVNFALLVGRPGQEHRIIHRWLLSDGSAIGINVAPGRFADPSGTVFSIPGIDPGNSVSVFIQGWGGNYDNISQAAAAGAGYGTSRVNLVAAGTSAAPPPSLVGMPSWDIRGIPEPSTYALALLGAGVCIAARRFRR